MKEKTILCIPDMQIPYQDKRFVKNLQTLVRIYEPDELVNVGDDIDSPEVSRWTKDSAGEYAGTLQRSLDETRMVHAEFRNALGDKPYHLSRSNHGDRIRKYVSRYAPALSSLRSLDISELAGYKYLDIQYHTKPFSVAPGWICCHGDEGSLSRNPGFTALALSKKFGSSVVCGHTHRAAIIPDSHGLKAERVSYGMEVGHAMDVGKAGYITAPNWQKAFGILVQRGSRVYPFVYYADSQGSFEIDGYLFPNEVPALEAEIILNEHS